MEQWLKIGPNQTKELTKSNEKMELESSVFEMNILDKEQCVSTSSNVKKVAKIRKYYHSYLSFEFAYVGTEEYPDGLCLLCNKTFSNSSLAPAKLKRHIETSHPFYKNKDIAFFENKLQSFENSKCLMAKKFKTEQENATAASYKASYRIALAGEAHTIGESLLKTIMTDVASCVLDEESVEKLKTVSLSNNTVARRIDDIARNIETKLISRLRDCDAYALQLDESTDVAGLAILLVFVRYLFDKRIDLLICKSLELRTTGSDIFNVIDDFMKAHDISWEKCISVCSDGAKSMTGKLNGTVTKVKNVAKNCKSLHSIILRYALVTKKMSPSLKKVLDEAVQIVNFIKSRQLQNRVFKQMCESMDSGHKSLLLHTEIRWLSRGKVLTRIFELKKELMSYFQSSKFHLSDRLTNPDWLLKLAYLADIFSKLNETCVRLQDKELSVFQAQDKMTSLLRKLQFWSSVVGKKTFTCFTYLSELIEEYGENLPDTIASGIEDHLSSLTESVQEYFPNLHSKTNFWVQNPFKITEMPMELTASDYESLIELTSDSVLKAKFEEVSIALFWGNLVEVYENLSKKVTQELLPFASTYLCESGFSRYAKTNTSISCQARCHIKYENTTITY